MLTCTDSTGETVLHALVFAATGKFTQQVDYDFIRKMLDKNMPLNRVTLETRDHEEVYVVTNYDYKMFLWAKSKGYGKTLTNTEFTVLPSTLTPAEARRFEKQAEK